MSLSREDRIGGKLCQRFRHLCIRYLEEVSEALHKSFVTHDRAAFKLTNYRYNQINRRISRITSNIDAMAGQEYAEGVTFRNHRQILSTQYNWMMEMVTEFGEKVAFVELTHKHLLNYILRNLLADSLFSLKHFGSMPFGRSIDGFIYLIYPIDIVSNEYFAEWVELERTIRWNAHGTDEEHIRQTFLHLEKLKEIDLTDVEAVHKYCDPLYPPKLESDAPLYHQDFYPQ